jgi:hypothetical protein
MTKKRTDPIDPRSPSRKRQPKSIIPVVVLLAIAACLGAVAAFGGPIRLDDSKSADDIAALASAAPSSAGSELAATADVDPIPSAAASATGDSRPSNTKSTAGRSGASSASDGGSGKSGSSSATNSGSGGKSGSSSATNSGSGGNSGNSGGNPSKPPKPAALTCTLSIDAETAGVGTIMPTRKVTFKKGQTVFDVLKRECRAAGIPMEFEYTPLYKSAYIEGINGLYEFDRGELSGWMYSVNGWFPNYGCSRYKLKAGDRIEWRYTCDLGKDIGGYYATGE